MPEETNINIKPAAGNNEVRKCVVQKADDTHHQVIVDSETGAQSSINLRRRND